MKPLISVVIPALNAARTISKAVNSVQAQILDDCEIIVVDDASTDDTENEARIMDNGVMPLRIIRHRQNRGVSVARETGIRAAKGEWIALLDADDEWHELKLLTQYKVMERKGAAGRATICLAYYENYFTGQGYAIPRYLAGPDAQNLGEPRWRRFSQVELERGIATWELWFLPGSTLFAHRDTLAANGPFLENLGMGEDVEYMTRHIRRGGAVHVVPEGLAAYTFPELGKTYARGADFHRYMLETYRGWIADAYGNDVAVEYENRLFRDCAGRMIDWQKSADEMTLRGMQVQQPELHFTLADMPGARFRLAAFKKDQRKAANGIAGGPL
jgi:glycosyltransferase involved in cell wall biosynthesis